MNVPLGGYGNGGDRPERPGEPLLEHRHTYVSARIIGVSAPVMGKSDKLGFWVITQEFLFGKKSSFT